MPGRRRDLLSGLICIFAGLGAVAEASSYTIGTLAKLGPGFYPAVLGALLTLTGVFIAGAALAFTPAAEEVDPLLVGPPRLARRGLHHRRRGIVHSRSVALRLGARDFPLRVHRGTR